MQYTGNEILRRILKRAREIREARQLLWAQGLSAFALALAIALSGLLADVIRLPGRASELTQYRGSLIITKDDGTAVVLSALMFVVGVATALIITARRARRQAARRHQPSGIGAQRTARDAMTHTTSQNDAQPS